jgi:biopolymer transport protein ExbD
MKSWSRHQREGVMASVKVNLQTMKKTRIELIPLVDMMILLLAFFIYAMLSMAIHRGLQVHLPTSSTAQLDQRLVLSITVLKDGRIYVNKEEVPFQNLRAFLKERSAQPDETGAFLFADRDVTYQRLFLVLDEIRIAGINRVSLQAERQESR